MWCHLQRHRILGIFGISKTFRIFQIFIILIIFIIAIYKFAWNFYLKGSQMGSFSSKDYTKSSCEKKWQILFLSTNSWEYLYFKGKSNGFISSKDYSNIIPIYKLSTFILKESQMVLFSSKDYTIIIPIYKFVGIFLL